MINKDKISELIANGIRNGSRNGRYPSIIFEDGERLDFYKDIINVSPPGTFEAEFPVSHMTHIFPDDLPCAETFEEQIRIFLEDFPPVSRFFVSF